MKKAIGEIPKITGTVKKGSIAAREQEDKTNRKSIESESRKKVICFENFFQCA